MLKNTFVQLGPRQFVSFESTLLILIEIPDNECKESTDDEDTIKDSKSNEQLVEGFPELFPVHDEYGDDVP